MQPHIQVRLFKKRICILLQGCPEARRTWMKLVAYIVDQMSSHADKYNRHKVRQQGSGETLARSVAASTCPSAQVSNKSSCYLGFRVRADRACLSYASPVSERHNATRFKSCNSLRDALHLTNAYTAT